MSCEFKKILRWNILNQTILLKQILEIQCKKLIINSIESAFQITQLKTISEFHQNKLTDNFINNKNKNIIKIYVDRILFLLILKTQLKN